MRIFFLSFFLSLPKALDLSGLSLTIADDDSKKKKHPHNKVLRSISDFLKAGTLQSLELSNNKLEHHHLRFFLAIEPIDIGAIISSCPEERRGVMA